MTMITGPSGVFEAHGPVADYWLSQPGHAEYVAPADQGPTLAEQAAAVAAQLKGEHLSDALQQLGLPDTGTADEKRQAIADALVNDNTPEA